MQKDVTVPSIAAIAALIQETRDSCAALERTIADARAQGTVTGDVLHAEELLRAVRWVR
jgi:hypothetical protein